MKNIIDVVIPVHKKDLAILEYSIQAAKDKIVGIRRIIVISKERHSNNAEWFDENLFPFSYKEIANLTNNLNVGWHFQQLLKFYAPLIIPDISENVLILDSDTVFFRKTKMIDDQGIAFYNISKDENTKETPFDQRVDEHIKKFFPAIAKDKLPKPFDEFSGICHNMIFNRQILLELFRNVEEYQRKENGVDYPFYKIFLMFYDNQMSVSEYQIYFNYMLIFHREKMNIRKIKYKNTADQNIKKYRYRFKYSYCSFHSHLQGNSSQKKSVNFFKNLYQKLFIIEKRNIGIVTCNIAEFLNIPNQKINWLKSSCASLTKPFGYIDNNSSKQIFFENKNFLSNQKEFKKINIDDEFNIKKDTLILDKNSTIFSPYIFSDEEKNFALIINKISGLTIYKIDEKNNFIEKKEILNELKITQASIVKFNAKWWLFFMANNEFNLFYSDNLFCDWQKHKNAAANVSEGAGQIFIYQNSIYRPVKNPHSSYRPSIAINKINELSVDNFKETLEIEITANQLDQYPDGINHISKLGENLTLLEGSRKVFHLHKPLIYVRNLLTR